MDRRVGAAVAALVVVVLGLVAWETFDDPGRHAPTPVVQLQDGFHVAPGSRLVGTVFPAFSRTTPGRAEGWSALLDVDGDAVTVFNAYLEQARRLGYRQVSTGDPCSSSDPTPSVTGTTTLVPVPSSGPVGQVICKGDYAGDGRGMSLELHVCSACDVPVSAAWIRGGLGDSEPVHDLTAIRTAPRALSLALSRAQHSRAWSHLPSAESSAREFAVTVRRGTRPLSPSVSFHDCTGDTHTVLEVTNTPTDVLASYVSRETPTDVVGPTHARVGSDDVTEWRNRWTTYTLVESARLRRPLLSVDVCSD